MAAEVDFIRYMFTGVEGEVIPQNATHFSIHESVKVIPREAFSQHQNIVELICHAGVKIIKRYAFNRCRRLKRVIIPGVKVVEDYAFFGCYAATYFECDKLEIIGAGAFCDCKSLSSINLPSATVVFDHAFFNCQAIKNVKFGKKLVGLAGKRIFSSCVSLQRITLPLKYDLIDVINNDIFRGCRILMHIDLVERAILNETIASLQLEEWRNDMNEELDYNNAALLWAAAGGYDHAFLHDAGPGEKTIVIRDWMPRLLRKIIHYKAAHRLVLEEAATALGQSLPKDVVTNNILPFLKLPLHRFDGEDIEEGRDDNSSSSSDEDSYESSYSSSEEEDYEEEVQDDEEDDDDGEEEEEGDDDNGDSSSDAGGNHDEVEEEEQDEEGGAKRRKIEYGKS